MNSATSEADSTEPVEAVHLVFRDDYSFDVSFRSEVPSHLLTDASPPLGKGAGPDSEMLLAAAVANCLCASLAFAQSGRRLHLCLQPAGVEPAWSKAG
jgi:hypothetical protein